MYIGDKFLPAKEGGQQDSPGLASHFPPMKTGLVEYANKRPKIMCLHPVQGGEAKVMEAGLNSCKVPKYEHTQSLLTNAMF